MEFIGELYVLLFVVCFFDMNFDFIVFYLDFDVIVGCFGLVILLILDIVVIVEKKFVIVFVKK